MTYDNKRLTVREWAKEDQPREKLLKNGASTLSDAELIAILMRVGTKGESVLDLSKKLLAQVDNDLDELARRGAKQLMKIDGIKQAKAVAIMAALELGKRRQLNEIKKKVKITSSADAYNLIAPLLMDLPHEEFWVLFLNQANVVMSREQLSQGGITGTVVDARMIFGKALEAQATSIILVHNHPSGNLRPSQADLDITRKLKAGGKLLDIKVLDHLIIAGKGYYSLADEGQM